MRAPSTETRLLRRLQWRLAGGFVVAFLMFDALVTGLTYTVLQYHFATEAKAAIIESWNQSRSPAASDADRSHRGAPRPLPSDGGPRVVTWQWNAQGSLVQSFRSIYGFPVTLNHVLPNRPLLQEMPYHHQPHWAVVNYDGYRLMIGSRPLWSQGRYLGAQQSIYSMGRIAATLRSLLIVDGELSVVVVVLVALLAFGLSSRALMPIRTALRRQRDFVQDISHELRTPLTVVKSTLELALPEFDRAGGGHAIRGALEEVDYMTRLMTDLAALARMDSGATLIRPDAVDLNVLLQEVVQALTPLAHERDVSLVIAEHPPRGLVEADPVQMRQLLIILMDNALKYNRPQGTATIAFWILPKRVRLRVSDTGPGILAEDIPHVFNRFYRSRSASRLAPGSGLGLAIAQWIVSAHHGTIRVESQLGGGTTFWVEWPQPIPKT